MALMTSERMLGKLRSEQEESAKAFKTRTGRLSSLAIGLSLNSSGKVHGPSASYVGMKEKYGIDIGVNTTKQEIAALALAQFIRQLNADDEVDSYMLQLPVPKIDRDVLDQHLDNLELPTYQYLQLLHQMGSNHEIDLAPVLCQMIDRKKDADGLNPESEVVPATALAIEAILEAYGVTTADMAGLKVVINGADGPTVGAPYAELLRKNGAVPVEIDKKRNDWYPGQLNDALPGTDVLVTATGERESIREKDLPEGIVIADASVQTEVVNGKLQQYGNIHHEVYDTKRGIWVTPAKKGIGPVTVRMLYRNHLRLAHERLDSLTGASR